MTELPSVTELIPHRGRWLLVQHIVRVDLDNMELEATGRFDVAFTDGHFPQRAVVPGVALLEGLAQTMACLGALLAAAQPDEGRTEGTPFLAAFDRVRFRAPVFPPAEVRFKVTVQESRLGLLMASGEARVDGKRVCTAKLTGGTVPAGAGADLPE